MAEGQPENDPADWTFVGDEIGQRKEWVAFCDEANGKMLWLFG